nr:VPA1269 family protein [uncultured Desulfuromonas sp.]
MSKMTFSTPPPRVITGKEELTKSHGFWSNKEILISQEGQPTIHLLNETLTTKDLIETIWGHLGPKLRKTVKEDYRNKMQLYESGISVAIPNFRFSKIPSLDQPEFYVNGSNRPGWPGVISSLRSKGKTDDEIHSFLTDAWLEEYQDNPPSGIAASCCATADAAYYLIDWANLDRSSTVGDFLKSIWIIADLCITTERFLGQKKEKRHLYLKENFEMIVSKLTEIEWQALSILGISHYIEGKYAYPKLRQFFSLPKTACYVLALLLKNELIMLTPLSRGQGISARLPKECSAQGMFDIFNVESTARGILFPILTSTNIRCIEDFPEDLPQHLKYSEGFSYHRHVRNLLMKYPSDKKGYKRINLTHYEQHALAKRRKHTGSPDWFIEKGYGNEWAEFSDIYINTSRASDTMKKRELTRFAEWACPRFKSPWDIIPTDLRDPSKPNKEDTWFAFIKEKWQKKSENWSNSGKMFKAVANQLNILGYPGYRKGVVRKSPFENIPNPFVGKSRPGNKTHRSRISSVLHDKMIKVLLSPDKNGTPTFRWAHEISKKHFYKHDFTDERTWCPSRWTALAFLLLLPPRKKNVRWLDQGLMDDLIFDPETFTMVENTHKLRTYRYEDGSSHLQKYSRPSGVVQPITDSFMGRTDYLGLFISTNKTQLWNPTKRNGFELPWPDGSELLSSDDPEVVEQGRWLRQVYEVLAFQLKFVQENDPYPRPVTFYDVTEDRGSISHDPDTLRAMPHFVPVFRDYREKVTIQRGDVVDYAYLPVSSSKIDMAFTALCREVEKLLRADGFETVVLTEPSETQIGQRSSDDSLSAIKSKFDVHCLRVAGISRLIEMDIDPAIVQEFIAGHLTPAMTHRYIKLQPWHVREKIIEAVINGSLRSAMDTWAENVSRTKSTENTVFNFVSAPRFREHVRHLTEDQASITPTNGGLCIMGGMGDSCLEGGLYERAKNENSRKKNKESDSVIETGPVQGGCGNCRFFRTAPFLIVEQTFYLDNIMSDLRAMARQRRDLRNRISDLDIEAADCTDIKMKHALENKRSHHKAKLEDLNQSMIPLITEWINRYLMLQDCQKQIDDHSENQTEIAMVSVFGPSIGLTADDLKVEHINTTDLDLIALTVENARMLEGRGVVIPEDKSRMLQKAVDVILRSSNAPHLLLDIDDKQVGRAASMLYNFLRDKFGAEAIEQAANRQVPLSINHHDKVQIDNLVEAIVSSSGNGDLAIEAIIEKTNNSALEGKSI